MQTADATSTTPPGAPGTPLADAPAAEGEVLTVTAAAAAQIRQLAGSEHGESAKPKPLRVYVEAGGCSGRKYAMTFDERREGDRIASCDGVEVVIDAESAPFLRGSVLDFSDELNGGGFKVVNPNARQSCGCGKSFEA